MIHAAAGNEPPSQESTKGASVDAAEAGLTPLSANQDQVGNKPRIPEIFLEQDPPSTSSGQQGLKLIDVIHLAFEASPNLQSTLHQLESADASLSWARSELFPRLQFNQNYAASDNPNSTLSFLLQQNQLTFLSTTLPNTVDDFHTQLQLTHSLYTGGRRESSIGAAAAERDLALHSLETAQNQLVFRVAEAYYRLLQANRIREVRVEMVAQVEHHLRIAKSSMEAGIAVRSDVLRVEVRLAEVREALIVAENRLEIAWAVLSNVVGARIDPTHLPEDVPLGPSADRQLETAISEALHSRPELLSSSSRMSAAAHRVDQACAGNRPTIDLLASYDVHSGDLSSGNDSFLAAVAVSLDLFDGGDTRSQIQRAKAELSRSQANHRRLTLDIELDVRRSYSEVSNARERLNITSQAILHAEESLREIEQYYEMQMATVQDLIDAQVALSQALVRHATAEAEVEIAQASLERSVGRLTRWFERTRE